MGRLPVTDLAPPPLLGEGLADPTCLDNLTAPAATARPALEAPSRVIRLWILEVYRRLRAIAAVAVMDKVAEEEVEGPASIHGGMVVVEAHILKIPVMCGEPKRFCFLVQIPMFLNRMNATIHKIHSLVILQDCVVFQVPHH